MFDLFPIHGGIAAVPGFYCDGVSAGLKKEGFDVGFIYADTHCDVEALFTQNRFQAAPLRHFQAKGVFQTNFVLTNAKNANAMTGDAGIADIEWVLEGLQARFPALHHPVMSSTGVIGVRLPKEKILEAALGFDLSRREGERFAQAIMTTDAFKKEIAFEVKLANGARFTIAAAAKGAGMIEPALATMLCFIVTDAAVPKADMKRLLTQAAHTSFNAISVDGDTSTNDTVMLLSHGKSGAYEEEAFAFALERVMHHLALLMAKDGEGATKLVAFRITGAANDADAQTAAKALVNSPLVKTALYGEDPNWGRIASTIGASGVACDPMMLRIGFEEVIVYDRGNVYFDKTQETKAAAVMKKEEFYVVCDLGLGNGAFTAYGCDLGYNYVKINADYRT